MEALSNRFVLQTINLIIWWILYMGKIATKPEVFIIESLDPDDEGNGRFEGGIISRILKLHGKSPKYRYVRTKEEFEDAVTEFGKSNYRYLHISAHADKEGMCTTNLEEIDFDELAEMLNPHLSGRRLFLSACSMVHDDLAKEIIPTSGCLSVIGPKEDICFTDAAILWSALYHLMFTNNNDVMKRAELKKHLKNTSRMFEVNISYFSKSAKSKSGFTKDILAKNA